MHTRIRQSMGFKALFREFMAPVETTCRLYSWHSLWSLHCPDQKKTNIFWALYFFPFTQTHSKWGITTYWCLSLGLVSILPQKQLEWMVFYEKNNIHSPIGQRRKFNFPWILLFRLGGDFKKIFTKLNACAHLFKTKIVFNGRYMAQWQSSISGGYNMYSRTFCHSLAHQQQQNAENKGKKDNNVLWFYNDANCLRLQLRWP